MTIRNLTIEPLSHDAFAPFGQVIQACEAAQHFTINDGNTERYHDLARLDPGPDGKAIVSIFRGLPRQLPFEVCMLERHPLASQAFVPLSGHPYLVVVAAAGEAPTIDQLRVFLCQPDQGVNYTAGVWHHPLLALEAISDFLVIDRSGSGHNCDIVSLDPAGLIESLP